MLTRIYRIENKDGNGAFGARGISTYNRHPITGLAPHELPSPSDDNIAFKGHHRFAFQSHEDMINYFHHSHFYPEFYEDNFVLIIDIEEKHVTRGDSWCQCVFDPQHAVIVRKCTVNRYFSP